MDAASLAYDDHEDDWRDYDDDFGFAKTKAMTKAMALKAAKGMKELLAGDEDDAAQPFGTLMKRLFVRQRRKLAKDRRHQALKYMEYKYRSMRQGWQDNLRDDYIRVDEINRAEEIRQAKEDKIKRIREVISALRIRRQRHIEARHEVFSGRYKGAQAYVDNVYTEWVRKARKDRDDLEAARRAAPRRQHQDERKPRAQDETDVEVAVTQGATRVMRRSGVISGANPPYKPPPSPPAATATYVVIRPNPTPDTTIKVVGKKGVKRQVDNYFDVDLQRQHNLQVLRAEKILDQGAMVLAHIFSLGGCSQIHTLHLGDCEITRRGLDGLIGAFSRGWGKNLETLNLRRNKLTGKAIKALADAFKKGGLPVLRHLDLRYNVIGDFGAGNLASAIMSESMKNLEYLLLQQNNIT